jgi:CRP-like cAMP-binding protein
MPPIALGAEEYAIVRRSAMFSGLDPDIATEVLAETRIEVRDTDQELFAQGSPAVAFYIVLSGWVRLSRLLPNGSEAIIGVFTRGQAFGEAVALTGAEYPVTAVAATPVRLIRIPVAPLRRMIAARPDVALAMIASTAEHLHQLVRQIQELKSQKGDERVAEFLRSLTDVASGPAVVALPFDKLLIAGRLGMQPESLSRAFSRLRRHGVRVVGARVEIDDVARLAGAFKEEAGSVGAPCRQED